MEAERCPERKGLLNQGLGRKRTGSWVVQSKPAAAGPDGDDKISTVPGLTGLLDTTSLGKKRCNLFGKNVHWL